MGEPDGINLWMPVRDERAALVHLAAEGIAVAAGTPFVIDAPEIAGSGAAGSGGASAEGAGVGGWVRVTGGSVIENVRLVAEALARAAFAPPAS